MSLGFILIGRHVWASLWVNVTLSSHENNSLTLQCLLGLLTRRPRFHKDEARRITTYSRQTTLMNNRVKFCKVLIKRV